ncbi:MAG: hypothetical protein K8T10_13625 [Candidatus Eremiobacteraeota bacterium]|nr:hypothetical protein [Candidatus Eremiobacteraeota bacterium]
MSNSKMGQCLIWNYQIQDMTPVFRTEITAGTVAGEESDPTLGLEEGEEMILTKLLLCKIK